MHCWIRIFQATDPENESFKLSGDWGKRRYSEIWAHKIIDLDYKTTHGRRKKVNDDLLGEKLPKKMNMQYTDFQHGLFATFSGKHFVDEASP